MELILGDCIEKLKEIKEDSIDLIVTDPPYGLKFMGAEWDDFVIKTTNKTSKVTALKNMPGGMRKTTVVENRNYQDWVTLWGKECLRILKPGAFAFVMSSPRQDVLSRMITGLEDAGFEIGFSSVYWCFSSGFPKAMNASKCVMKKVGDSGIVTGRKDGDRYNYDFKNNKGKFVNNRDVDMIDRIDIGNIIEPINQKAKELVGSFAGFQPKPSLEAILVVMKPLDEKTYLDQAMKTGKGVTWMGDCRVPYKTEDDMIPQLRKDKRVINSNREMYGGKSYNESKTKAAIGGNKEGRFPANLIVSDNILDDGTITKSLGGKSGHTGAYGGGYKEEYYVNQKPGYGDVGGFSRYFSLDAWWSKQLEKLPEKVRQTFPFFLVSKPSTAEKNKGLTGKGNVHIAVKPVKLMAYLVTLGSREGDIILDPFMGSGTTGIACKTLKRDFIGIEKEQEYFRIAERRIKAVEEALL